MSENKFVVVTSGGMNGRRLTQLFSNNNIPYELLTVSFPLPKNKKGLTLKFALKYLKSLVSNIGILRQLKMRSLPAYPVKSEFVGRINGAKMFRRLQQLSPDYIFMMGGGILKDNIISTAKKGVLNAHPGILPYIRGVDAIKHAILKDVPLGVTAHFIDSGIDTGAIIDRFWLPVDSQTTFDQVTDRSNDLSVAVMMHLAVKIIDGNKLTRDLQQNKYKLCRKLGKESSDQAIEKFNKNWYEIHQRKVDELSELSSGLELLKLYDTWWSGIKRF